MVAPRIGIIGAGFTGLTAAYRLTNAGCDVTIFEASGDLGGLASGLKLAGHSVEKAYHFLYKTDEHILALVEELGLSDRLTYHRSSVSTYYDGVVYPMMTPVDLIRFIPIGFVNRDPRGGYRALSAEGAKLAQIDPNYGARMAPQMGRARGHGCDLGAVAAREIRPLLRQGHHGLAVGPHQTASR